MRMPLSLYYLAAERRVRKIASAFGIGKSTVLKVGRGVTMAIYRLLSPQSGADEQELATPILSLCHGIFTD